MSKKSILLVFGVAAFLALGFGLLKAWQEQQGGGYDFTLTDHHGTAVTGADYAGQYKLIYFGFTSCPMICPTELQKMNRVMKLLESEHESRAIKILPLFITVDPERDDVQTMAEYVELFHPRLVGLTGTDAQIEAAKASFRAFSRKVDDPALSEYTVDHSSYMYLLGPANAMRAIYKSEDSAQLIAEDLKQRL